MNISTRRIVVSCEHGGNHIPAQYRALFGNKKSILNSHRAWDAGALILARELSCKLNAPLIASETSRLLVDLNRSLHHHHLFSEFTRHCEKETKKNILREFYFPYRNKVEMEIGEMLKSGKPVIHFSIHSFTPELNDEIRNADIGLLYDPVRKNETGLCKQLQALIRKTGRGIIVRRNYPYRGNADGLTTCLRKRFPQSKYLGIEIEINQRHVVTDKTTWRALRQTVIGAIRQLIQLK